MNCVKNSIIQQENIVFSIIVPVYNVETYLRECLDSLLNQTMTAIEIILVNDGSTDQSGEICDLYAKEHKNIKVLHQKNQGQSKARNEGIKKASGEYLMFVDSDDYILKNACETFSYYINKYDADIYVGDMLNDRNYSNRKKIATGKVVSGRMYLQSCLANGTYDIVPWLKIIRRKFFLNHKLFFFEGCFYEDQEFTLRLFLHESKVLKVDFPFYYYRENLLSTTHVFERKKGTDCIKIIRAMIQDIEEAEYSKELVECANNIIAMSVYHLSQIYIHMGKEDRDSIYLHIDKQIRDYAKKTKLLSYRMKFQNRLFIFFPHLLMAIFKVKYRR